MQARDLRQLQRLASDLMDAAEQIASDMKQVQSTAARLEDIGGTENDIQLIFNYLELSAKAHYKMTGIFPFLLTTFQRLKEGN